MIKLMKIWNRKDIRTKFPTLTQLNLAHKARKRPDKAWELKRIYINRAFCEFLACHIKFIIYRIGVIRFSKKFMNLFMFYHVVIA